MEHHATDDVIRGYSASSVALVSRFEAISSDLLYQPVIDLLPDEPARIADIGAGTGRDAAWLAGKGHAVTAIEPVAEFRQAGIALHGGDGIVWIDDRLPALDRLPADARFDRIVLTGVWQHLDDSQRVTAMRRLADLTAPGGLVIMSLRHGGGAPDRPVFDAHPLDTIEAAASVGLDLGRECRARSIQAENQQAGVFWTWLAFRSSKT